MPPMKRILLSILLLFVPLAALADDNAGHSMMLDLTTDTAIKAGNNVHVTALLRFKNGKPVLLSDLTEVHTQKIHLLVADPSLSDYHHVHPLPGKIPGEYVFDFVPKTNNIYRVWADLTPQTTGKQEYVVSDVGVNSKNKPSIDKTENNHVTVDGYDFTLSMDNSPKAGQETMITVSIEKGGKPFKELEPLMGAYAHVVGFNENYKSIMHIHPMGEEPKSADNRSGPTLDFHMIPQVAGFTKLFVQIHVGGKDIFAPFGIKVN